MSAKRPRGETYIASGADITLLQHSALQHAPEELVSMVLREANRVPLYAMGIRGQQLGGKIVTHSIVADGRSLGFLVGLIDARIHEAEARRSGELARYISGKDQASGAVRMVPGAATVEWTQ